MLNIETKTIETNKRGNSMKKEKESQTWLSNDNPPRVLFRLPKDIFISRPPGQRRHSPLEDLLEGLPPVRYSPELLGFLLSGGQAAWS